VNVIEDESGQRCAKDAGERQAGQKESDGLRLFALAEPVGEIEDDSGEVAGFGESQEKTKDVELGNILDEASEGGENSPGDDDARQPDARPEFVQQQIAGNFEEKVSNEKDAGKKPELLGADAEVTVHGKCGEADVDAVEERDDIEEEDKGKDAKLQLANGGRFDGGRSQYRGLSCRHTDLALGMTGSEVCWADKQATAFAVRRRL